MLSEYYELRAKANLTIQHVLQTTPFIDIRTYEDTETLPTANLNGKKYQIVLVSAEGFKGEDEAGKVVWFRPKDLPSFDLCLIAELVSI